MKKILFVLLFIVVYSKVVDLNDKDTIYITKKKAVNISIDYQPSTGYKWVVHDSTSNKLEITEYSVETQNEEKLKGGWELEHFRVKCNKCKKGERLNLVLEYKRSWVDEPGRKKKIKVIVKK